VVLFDLEFLLPKLFFVLQFLVVRVYQSHAVQERNLFEKTIEGALARTQRECVRSAVEIACHSSDLHRNALDELSRS